MSNKSYAKQMTCLIEETLVGGVITGVFLTPADEHAYIPEGYGFMIKSKDGVERHVFVLMDEEANGPGHLDIQNLN